MSTVVGLVLAAAAYYVYRHRLTLLVNREVKRVCTGQNASFDVLDAGQHGYRLVGSEKLLAVQGRLTRDTVDANDTGRLIVTSNALVWEGREKNDRWTWAQVANVRWATNGYRIERRRGKPVQFLGRPKASVCARIHLMLNRIG